MNLRHLLETSLADAKVQAFANEEAFPNATPQKKHRERSRLWVESLAESFRNRFSDEDSIRVFSKHHELYQGDFGLNELLYDVLVCRTDTVPAAIHSKELRYIQKALWQVESEFAQDSRQALFDFNKLVIGAADNKLFIGPIVSKESEFLNTLLPAARYCSGNVFVALIPHPADWTQDSQQIKLWQLIKNWEAME